MKTSDNVFLDPGYYQSLLVAYDPRFARQELDAEFLKLTAGAVYHQFARDVHVDARVAPDPGLDVHVSFDFNRTPYSVLILQTKNADRGAEHAMVVAVDEISMTDAGTEQMCAEVISRLASLGLGARAVEVFGDATGSTRHTNSNESDYDIITRDFRAAYGPRFVRCWPWTNPPILSRTNAVNGMLRNVKGAVRLALHPRCVKLRRDLEQVSFLPGSREIDKRDKSLTHMSDALGYFIQSRFPIRALTSATTSM